MNATREDQVLSEISRLAGAHIKGLGPAFNALFGDRKKLGSWESYLQMREVIVQSNNACRDLLSKDLGAFAGLLFEIGAGRLVTEGNAAAVLQVEKRKTERAVSARHVDVLADVQEVSEHTQIQYLLIKIGRALKYDVFVARNDHHRSCDGQSFLMLTVLRSRTWNGRKRLWIQPV